MYNSVWAPRVRGTFPQDPLKHIHVTLVPRPPASDGPEERYRAPSALCITVGQWFLQASHGGLRRWGGC